MWLHIHTSKEWPVAGSNLNFCPLSLTLVAASLWSPTAVMSVTGEVDVGDAGLTHVDVPSFSEHLLGPTAWRFLSGIRGCTCCKACDFSDVITCLWRCPERGLVAGRRGKERLLCFCQRTIPKVTSRMNINTANIIPNMAATPSLFSPASKKRRWDRGVTYRLLSDVVPTQPHPNP